MSYQFRFGFKEEELNEIFNDSEILEKLNKAILKNEEKVNKFINDVKEEVILLIEKDHEPREDFKNLTEEYLKLFNYFNFTISDYKKMNLYAIENSFLSKEEKDNLKEQILI